MKQYRGITDMISAAKEEKYITLPGKRGELQLSACSCGARGRTRVKFKSLTRATKRRPKIVWKCRACGQMETIDE